MTHFERKNLPKSFKIVLFCFTYFIRLTEGEYIGRLIGGQRQTELALANRMKLMNCGGLMKLAIGVCLCPFVFSFYAIFI